MFTNIGFTGGSAWYGMMCDARKKIENGECDVIVKEVVAVVGNRAEVKSLILVLNHIFFEVLEEFQMGRGACPLSKSF